ncbi:MAG TPA: ABC transporter ATP-binding protein [Candidatus Latescibacteria bacterium]|nr:ABC transporter ATP-binding protein [Candidatus Latescibacterota bacterium]|tara:strand:+ start:2009 stop:3094 length:1086 start_codon:yes stop_codon:yes gene_type:complete
MTAPALRLSGIGHRYGSTVALEEVSLAVDADELVVVLGPSGAGKTTLLRTIAGLELPAAGRVELHGDDVTRWTPAQRDVAFVFQNFSLYPGWTVRQNLAFPLLAPARRATRGVRAAFRVGADTEEIDERIDWAARLLGIERLLERPAELLSGGEMQRVAIGRAIVRRPRLFLLDEPLTNLDAKLREQLRVELVVLRRELGIPMVYVTHDQSEALAMGDRVVVLHAGRVLQEGTAQQVYERPRTPKVARQLGQPAINLIPLRRSAGQWCVDGAEQVPVEVGLRVPDGDQLWFGIRPEAVAVAGGSHEGTVRLVEDTGPGTILLLDWAGQELHLLVDKSRKWSTGDHLAPYFDPERALLWQRS